MFNAQPIQLLNDQIFIKENTIGNTMNVAKIPEHLNESRLTSFLAFITGDNALPRYLTIQERYFLLLNYLAITTSEYSDGGDNSEFFIQGENKPPQSVEVSGIHITHLYGHQAMALEHKCENVYEWLCGQIAMQCYGDMSIIFGKDKNIIWEPVTTDNQQDVEQIISNRFEQIEQLTDNEFASLTDIFYQGCDQLAHFVEPNLDNEGITLVSTITTKVEKVNKNGEKEVTEENRVARFRPLANLPTIVKQLAEYIVQ